MNLREQLTSPELSNKLHQLGVIAPSVFSRDWTGAKPEELEWAENFEPYYCEDNVNAYSVAELGEMLPDWVRIHHSDGYWHLEFPYQTPTGLSYWYETEITEADARAKMLIYLLENKLIGVERVQGQSRDAA